MNILVVNDDGISAPGIVKLSEIALRFGHVTVVAPKTQCSAMSSRVTICSDLCIKKEEFPVPNVKAYSVTGTPVDCVKAAVELIMKDNKPDVVFSGINRGYNLGIETIYSGTVGAAMEALFKGIPAFAFSIDLDNVNYETVDEYLPGIIEELLKTPIREGHIWNVNIPTCHVNELKGILRDRIPSKVGFYPDTYDFIEEGADYRVVQLVGMKTEFYEEGTDIEAVMNNYISIGTLRNMILG